FYDLRKHFMTVASAPGEDGTPGVRISYALSIVLAHPSRTGDQGTKGMAPLASPFTFTDNLSSVSPNAQLLDWDPTAECRPFNAVFSLPYGRIGTPSSATATNSVPDSGTFSCTDGSPGGSFTVTIDDADTTGSSFPSMTAQAGGTGNTRFVV